jgi:hypothetical protein
MEKVEAAVEAAVLDAVDADTNCYEPIEFIFLFYRFFQ